MPCTFQGGSLGWTFPVASIARQERIVLARLRLPAARPAAPGKRGQRRIERGLAVGAVYAELHARDADASRPGAAGDLHHAALDGAAAGEKVGEAGRDHQGARADSLHRLARIRRVATVPVGHSLLVAVERLGHDVDAGRAT